MNPETARRLHVTVVLCIGLLAATALALLLPLLLPKPGSSLADRTDAARAFLYIRSENRDEFLATLKQLEAELPGRPVTDAEVPIARLYEFVALKTASGAGWMMETEREGSTATVISQEDPQLFLLPERHARSLARSPLFSSVTPETESFTWMRLAELTLPEGPGPGIVSGMLSAYDEALVIHAGTGRGTLHLQGAPLSSRTMTSIATALPSPSFFLEVSDPAGMLGQLALSLYRHDRALAEGLSGIAKAWLREHAGTTDIHAVIGAYLAGPVSIAVLGEENPGWVVVSSARRESDVAALADTLASVNAGGVVRHLRFFDENSRTDVVPGATSPVSLGEEGGWSFARIGSGSTSALFLGTSGRRFALSSDESLLRSVTSGLGMGSTAGALGGVVEMEWLREKLRVSAPDMLPGLKETVAHLIGPGAARIEWKADAVPGGLRIDWRLTRSAL